MHKLPVDLPQLTAAMSDIKIFARQQIIEGHVKTIYDVAHNAQSVDALAEFIANLQCNKVRAVFSAMHDKDLRRLIRPMHEHVDVWYPAIMQTKRAANEALLRAAFHAEIGDINLDFHAPVDAYNAALQDCEHNDIIVVYGSFVIVGAIMAYCEQSDTQIPDVVPLSHRRQAKKIV